MEMWEDASCLYFKIQKSNWCFSQCLFTVKLRPGMKSISFLEKVYIFYMHGQEHRNRDYNRCSKTGFMI